MKTIFSLSLIFFLTFIGCDPNKDTKEDISKKSLVWMKITPNQCEAPWIEFDGDDTASKLKAYLNQKSIALSSFKETPLDIMSCAACGCPGTVTYEIQIANQHIKTLEGDGFSKG